MSSNIRFESNVHPVSGRVNSDKKFISKIWDYERICTLDKRYFQNVPWNEIQRQILKELPTCSWNKEDPCWGMMKTITGYRWISRCTKTDCRFFASCRSEVPYDPSVEKEFAPDTNQTDEYGYTRFLAEYDAFPVLVGDDTEYTDSSFIHKKEEKRIEAVPSPFEYLIRKGDNPSSVEETTPIFEPDDPKSAVPTDRDPEPEPETKPDNPHADLCSASLNVFEHFVEGSQEEVITASSHENYFVDAGPGTGKTYTLIQKINHLVCNENVEADGILVLCFTNAAVDEIKVRLKQFVENGADRSLINVDVRTFHSFAWWLINQANTVLTDSGWSSTNMQTLTYETSLIKASEVVSRFGKDVVGNWDYFIVDEVQDLTNTLGRFVLKIVSACLSVGCGVTVLGDACQAIYDYDQETRSAPMKSTEFYKALFRKMYGNTKFLFLTENYRQGSGLIKLTSELREAILSSDVKKMRTAVEYFGKYAETTTATGSSINEAFLEKMRAGGSVSLLLRNNGQTLKMSSDLRKRGVSHTLNIAETNNNFAPWIADVFASYKKTTISEDRFLGLYEDITSKDGSDVWRRLQKLLHTDNDVMNVRELLNAIAVSKIDDSLLRTVRERSVVVSNIHRSKGREYDCVVVDKSYVDLLSDESSADEFKTLYVAITRPRKKIVLASLQDKSGMKIISIYATGRKRWGKTKNKKIAYLEFDSAKDLGCDCFAGIPSERLADISVGDAVYLKSKLSGKGIEYAIIHEDTENTIGTVDVRSNYLKDLMAYMKIDAHLLVEMPATISDLYVSGVYTQVVDDKYLDLHPEVRSATTNGVWKWVELVGIGHADYDVY